MKVFNKKILVCILPFLVCVVTFAWASSVFAQSGAKGGLGERALILQACTVPTVPAGFTISQVNATPIGGPAGLAFPPPGGPFGNLLYVADTASRGGDDNIMTVKVY